MWQKNFFRIIEINPTELCNMKCVFCPRAYDYPNSNLHMSIDTVEALIDQLDGLPALHTLHFAGRGEPTLHKYCGEMMELFSKYQRDKRPNLKFDFVTNGKRLDQFKDCLKIANIKLNIYDESTMTPREAWSKYKSWGNIELFDRRTSNRWSGIHPLGYHNRGGYVNINMTRTADLDHERYGLLCEKPFYVLYVNWNGEYNLCCNDWNDIQVLGNIFDTPIEQFIFSDELKQYQQTVVRGRLLNPCASCNRPLKPKWVEEMGTEAIDEVVNSLK